jgi:hypothetical protein
MQTFLPYADFARTAEVLDRARLGKQRVEAIQVVRALTIPTYGWRHHPAALMWRGHLEALGAYSFAIVDEWTRQGYADTCAATIARDLADAGVEQVRTQAELAEVGALPPWLGDRDFHQSHQSALVRKDPEHYGPIFTGVPADLPYVWPTPEETRSAPRRGS